MIKLKILRESGFEQNQTIESNKKLEYLNGNCLRFALAIEKLLQNSHLSSVIMGSDNDYVIAHVAIFKNGFYIDANGKQTKNELINNTKIVMRNNGINADEFEMFVVNDYNPSWWHSFDYDAYLDGKNSSYSDESIGGEEGMMPDEPENITISNAKIILNSL